MQTIKALVLAGAARAAHRDTATPDAGPALVLGTRASPVRCGVAGAVGAGGGASFGTMGEGTPGRAPAIHDVAATNPSAAAPVISARAGRRRVRTAVSAAALAALSSAS